MAGSYEKRLMRVLEYIHANPAGDLSLDRLADVAAIIRRRKVSPVPLARCLACPLASSASAVI